MAVRQSSTSDREPTWAAELCANEESRPGGRKVAVALAGLAAFAAILALVAVAQSSALESSEATDGVTAVPTDPRVDEVGPRWASIQEVDPREWRRQLLPKLGPPEAIGSYGAGCVRGAVPIPVTGLGYQAMRLSRKRFYGHPELVDYLQDLGRRVFVRGLGVVLLSDLAQARGGPTMTDHRSHQSGLDVDVWYGYSGEADERRLSAVERETLPAPVVVDRKTGELSDAWTPEMAELLRLAASDARVSRVFVHPAVKQELCRTAIIDRSWLNKVSPWWKHHDHFHVRLHCPASSPDCVEQAPLHPGDGCDHTLAWWLRRTKPHRAVNGKATTKKTKKKRVRKKGRRKAKKVGKNAPRKRVTAQPERCLEVL